jgi:hypothetical protein
MSMRYEKTEHGFIVQTAFAAPSDDEWRKLLDFMRANKDTVRAAVVFVHGDNALTAKQRSELADVIKLMRPGFRTAVLTESRVTRGVLTALNWLTKKQDDSRAFPLDGFDDAMAFLRANADESRAARELAKKLGAFTKPGRAANG